MDELLRVENLIKKYPGVTAVNNVSFHVNGGEVLALLGENGAGKSTVSKMISGVEQPDSGRIIIEGKEVHFASALDAIKKGVSMVHQELSTVGEMNVAENIFINRQPINTIKFIDWKKLYKDTRTLLEEFNLKIDPHTQVKRLSVGTQQLLEIIRATSTDAKLIILDEPTSSLAESQVKMLFNIIKNLKKKGYGLIYITHKLEEVMEIADRIVVLRDGCFVAEKEVKETNVNDIVTMMVGREIKQFFGEELKKREISENYYLEVQNLTSRNFYHDISFGVKKGEIVGIGGLIGAGRTEMALGIFHAHKRDGKILLDGKELKINSPGDAIKNGFAYVTEDRKKLGLYLDYPIERNIPVMQYDKFSNRLGSINWRKVNTYVKKEIEEFNIATPSEKQLIGHLSGGNQQKCLLAMWMGLNPKVIIVDEPTRGIDVGAKSEIYQMLKNLAEEGKSIIVISSELPELMGICDRIIVMHEGSISGSVNKSEFSEDRIMQLATGVKCIKEESAVIGGTQNGK